MGMTSHKKPTSAFEVEGEKNSAERTHDRNRALHEKCALTNLHKFIHSRFELN